MKTLLMTAVLFILVSTACQSAQNSVNMTPPRERTQEEIQKDIRKKQIARMEQMYSKPDRPAKLTADEKEETLIVDSAMVTCESVAPVMVNPDNNKVYRDLGFKQVTYIDPRHPGGKCTFDVSKTTY